MTALAAELLALARRVERNLPRRDDPEAFHAEKSDIVETLKAKAKEAEA